MRYWVYDEEGKLFRKFAFKAEALNFLQDGWKMVIQPKPKPKKITPEEYGFAPF
jgi:hypothetical protein